MDGFELRTRVKREQVLGAAFDLVNTGGGAEALSIAAVAVHSHVSRATIFNYFGSRQGLISGVFDRFLAQIAEGAEHIVTQDLPFAPMMMALTRYELDSLSRVSEQFYRDLMRWYAEDDGPGMQDLRARYTRQSFGILLSLFAKGRKEGSVDPEYSDEFLLLYLRMMTQGALDPGIRDAIVPYSEQFVKMLIKGIAPSPSR
ncbi:TetR/AcrR family transcriptional regulator [Bifidobacterium sp.]|uniref:TetR/AcrR family transcriptional regulator n=1 Tax=Bifidobacterium sp. TaxID=41200 RepID=UPI0025B9381A|nr:TetR/AcrR family transcriptional regulator [Bifidobacterium sp.]MCH4208798.1 TetR/AcrR family transcriptional regulator [Bifidobacterium sp.]MCI1224756.1 TetR/AcrR family transcriptional regulator [Bifidobacterium sp.]